MGGETLKTSNCFSNKITFIFTNLLKQTLFHFPKHLLDVNSLTVSRVDYRRRKSLSQN